MEVRAKEPLRELIDVLNRDGISDLLSSYLALKENADKQFVKFFQLGLKNDTLIRPFDKNKLGSDAQLLKLRNENYSDNHAQLEKEDVRLGRNNLTREFAEQLKDQFEKFPQLNEIESQINDFFKWAKSSNPDLTIREADIVFLYNMMRQDYIVNFARSYVDPNKNMLEIGEIDFIYHVGTYLFPKTATENCASFFKKNIINDIQVQDLSREKDIKNYLEDKIKEFQQRADYLLLSPQDQKQKLIELQHYLLGDLQKNKELQPSQASAIEKSINSVFKKSLRFYSKERATRGSILARWTSHKSKSDMRFSQELGLPPSEAANKRIDALLDYYASSRHGDELRVMQRAEMEKLLDKLKLIPSVEGKIKHLKDKINAPGVLGRHHADTFVGRIKNKFNIDTLAIKQLTQLNRELTELHQRDPMNQQGIFSHPHVSPQPNQPSSGNTNKPTPKNQ